MQDDVDGFGPERTEPFDIVFNAVFLEIDEAAYAVRVQTRYGLRAYTAARLDVAVDVHPGSTVLLFCKPDGTLTVRLLPAGLVD